MVDRPLAERKPVSAGIIVSIFSMLHAHSTYHQIGRQKYAKGLCC